MNKNLIAILVGTVLLQGCAAAVVAGTAGAVTAANDRRTIGSQIDDNNIEIKTTMAIKEALGENANANVSVVSYNGIVLLLGQVPSEQYKTTVQRAAERIDGTRKLHNQLRIGSPTSITTQSHDTWLTSKIKTQLLAAEDVSGNNIKVVTENGEVFLMGLVADVEANKAVNIARNISGVERVVKVFEYM
ncbi:divisome-associated lipoprotein YraP [Pseudoalteromonas sp. CO325X]|uniref:division/outer membrane stress-associated lipid-binding lipoprotein n=1 Tax=Pseudoalteromonas sp. CO325X TaxID=1777262 RepID=UPI001023B29E|nr:division/outer membrane stress-associated lipid-binding lipoprotein [Pseudoalteromonas sp. CO325X]RZF79100.1 divisome-associated lipoprotein YraP [Pseudoalteromonas sp. CO325X]